jgi:protein-disulfide isomerase
MMLLAPATSRAQDTPGPVDGKIRDYLASHPDELAQLIKDYLVKHPEMIGEILAAAPNQRPSQVADNMAAGGTEPIVDRAAAVSGNAELLFSSPRQVTLGNPDGDVTLVEFFDYNCGFCKRALPDLLALINDNPKLKIVLKELPILGPGSTEAARVAVAVRMQDRDGQKYLAFHRQVLESAGPATKEKALAAAQSLGLDMGRLERDLASEEVSATLAEGTKLARAVGISGTPGYVIGRTVVLGAVGATDLQTQIDTARRQLADATK